MGGMGGGVAGGVSASALRRAAGSGGSGNLATTEAAAASKDYIHVRARRGQATDSHSLAERVSDKGGWGRE